MELLSGLHPKVIHFPIVLFILYFLFEAAGTILKIENLNSVAYYLLIGGISFSLLAVLTGNQAFSAAQSLLKDNNPKLIDRIEEHEFYATITVWYFFILLVLRTYLLLKKKLTIGWKKVLMVAGLAGCYFLIRAAHLGGVLVYDYGIGTNLLK